MVWDTCSFSIPVKLLTSFTEGFGLDINSDGSYPYGYSEGSNFTLNLEVDTIDFGTFHLYPSSCGHSSPDYTLPAANFFIKGVLLTLSVVPGSLRMAMHVQQQENPVFLRSMA
jgi:hypothetical protein